MSTAEDMIMQAKKIVAEVLPLCVPATTALTGWITGHMTAPAAIAAGISGTVTALWLWSRQSPFTEAAPEEIPQKPGGGAAAMLVVAFAAALAMMLFSHVVHAAPLETKTSSAAPSKIAVSLYAQAAILHADGTLGVGPSMCVGYKLSSDLFPTACASLEVARGPDGAIAGHFGPQIGVVVPAMQAALGLHVPPCFTVGWALFRIGPGNLIDSSKGSFLLSGSFPFLGL